MDFFPGDFHLLRPEWLLMLVPLLILSWLFWSKKLFSRDWESVIDARLLPYLLVGQSGRRSIKPYLLWITVGMIIIVVLSGPVWKKLPLPVFKQQSALVILLDLSTSMNSEDIKPSRLVRARLKLLDLLKQRREGQTALVVFAATAYTVSPLTDDTDTIGSLVRSLTTDIMPVQGSRADLAITKALELFQNAGINQGDMLLITDGLSAKSANILAEQSFNNYPLSVLVVGTEQGAPVPAQSGGFIKDSKGSIVIAKTDLAAMQSLTSHYGGVFNRMTLDDGDLIRIQKMFGKNKIVNDHQQTDFKADRWREEGPWFLLLVTPLVALIFKRGILLSLLLVFFILPMPRPVLAIDMPKSWPDWQSLWRNTDQRAQQSFKQGDAETAASLFNRADWKAASFYKAGQYEQALEQLENLKSTENKYNRANTLAKLGNLQEALDSYDEILRQQPDHEDALFNRKLVEDELNKQQQQDGKQGQDDQQQSDQQKPDNQKPDESEQQQNQQPAQHESADEQNKSAQQQDQNQDQQQQQQDKEKQQAEQQQQQQNKEQAEKAEKAEQAERAEQQQNEKPQQQQDEGPDETLSEQAEAQWLRRIPDDPGGLLRNKFKYQYSRQQQPSQEKEPW